MGESRFLPCKALCLDREADMIQTLWLWSRHVSYQPVIMPGKAEPQGPGEEDKPGSRIPHDKDAEASPSP